MTHSTDSCPEISPHRLFPSRGYRYRRLSSVLAALVLALLAPAAFALSGIALTKHNLTPSGPGPVRDTVASGLCVFCHTPHNASPTRALWNRDLPGVTYTLYHSSTMQATTGQPTGNSLLCLSCHDGVLAMGNVRTSKGSGPFTLGPMTGSASLGTDLSDDHPISFTYDTALASMQGELADPATLPNTVPLDENQQLQCTSCHEPHEDVIPEFLRVDNRYGMLCTTCHTLSQWNNSIHATSTATWSGSGTSPWPANAYASVAENACGNCHRSHAAGHGEWLLASNDEPSNCTDCHNGTVAQKDIATEFTKPFHHPIETSQWIHQPQEDPLTMPDHVACDDCHNPHAADSSPAGSPLTVAGSQREVSGVDISGTPVATATFKYEICLKCHGEHEPATTGFLRTDSTRNIRLRIDPSNPSYHPVAAPGKNTTITGLAAQYTASSQIGCIDCHDNDNWTAGGSEPQGAHGSNYEYILAKQYETTDPVVESPSSYALCYSCHDRSTLLTPGNGFLHDTHVVNDQASCAVCHDAHGSRNNPYLVDFMTRTKAGAAVVTPSSGGLLQFQPASPGHGSCYLTCHGHDHNPSTY